MVGGIGVVGGVGVSADFGGGDGGGSNGGGGGGSTALWYMYLPLFR